MKVISQLVRHFWERGVLTAQEMDYLLQHGFLRRRDFPDGTFPEDIRLDEPDRPYCETIPPAPTDLDLEQEKLTRTRRRGGASELKAKELQIAELLGRLQAEYDRRAGSLKSIVAVAQRQFAAQNWQKAAADLRSLSGEQFFAELSGALRAESVRLDDLWTATDLEPFHQLLSKKERRGRVVRAFLAALTVDDMRHLGRHIWILSQEQTQSLWNLRLFHARYLASLARLLREDHHLLTRALDGSRAPVQIWALILLYNALRAPSLGEIPQPGREYGPLNRPSNEIWRSAWTNALRMDRTSISRFFVACYDTTFPSRAESDDDCRRPLLCPVGWRAPDEARE